MTVGVGTGPPGVRIVAAQTPQTFTTVRLDVAGFVGVAPRGPVDVPTPVESWSDYRWRFGGYDGPGLLPWAVRAFFAQGGRRAYVCRVSPLPRADSASACAEYAVEVADRAGAPLRLTLRAADEGSWGNRLDIRLRFDAEQRFRAASGEDGLRLPAGLSLPAYSLLRVRGAGLPPAGDFRWLEGLDQVDDGPVRVRVARTDRSLPGGVLDVEVVTASLLVEDRDPDGVRTEAVRGLGLRRGHPRFAPDRIDEESLLVCAGTGWPDRILPADPLLEDRPATLDEQQRGVDRWAAIGRESLVGDLDPGLLPLDGPDPEGPRVFGADLLSLVPEIALLAAPDLFWSYAEAEYQVEEEPPRRYADFAPCRPAPLATTSTVPARAARLDARTELPEILDRQRRLVALAERQRRFVALLDVPELLSVAGIVRWRNEFDSSYAAAYHPWLTVPGRPVPGEATLGQPVPPSAFAAGIVAERERRLGISRGPANELAREAVLAAPVTDAEHTTLHEAGVNVFRAEPDGYRLTSACTLARDVAYRQLTVRRLMTMLRLVLERQSQWLVFEPHTPLLRRRLRDAIVRLLRDLYRGGAFAGSSEAEAFFVRCDETVNPGFSTDLGRLVAEVGVAPSVPLEFLLVRISQETDGTLRVVEG